MNYQYFNPNKKRKNGGDCVIRALCKALRLSWEQVYAILSVEGFASGDWGNSNDIWESYLGRIGYKHYTIPNTCPACYTISDFARDNPTGTYIVCTGSHVVTIENGTIYDTYDSGDKTATYYFCQEAQL